MSRSDADEELAYFRKRITALAQAKGWSCEELCRRAGFRASMIADYWWRRGPGIDEVAAFAKTLGVTSHEIWYDEPVGAKDDGQQRASVKSAVLTELAPGPESFSSKPARRTPSKAHVLSTADVCCVLNDMRPRVLGNLRRKGKIEFLPDHNGEIGFRRRHIKDYLCREWEVRYNVAALKEHGIDTERIEKHRQQQCTAELERNGREEGRKLRSQRQRKAEQRIKTELSAPMRLIAQRGKSREARVVLNRFMHWCGEAAQAGTGDDTQRKARCDWILREYHDLIERMLPPSKSKGQK